MKANDFRRMALRMHGAVEGSHMAHPDFRANGRIFATIYPDNVRGMVQLTPDQQRLFVRDHAEVFEPASGAWGRGGSTTVRLAAVDAEVLGDAMTLAWQNTVTAATARKANTSTTRTPTAPRPGSPKTPGRRTAARSGSPKTPRREKG